MALIRSNSFTAELANYDLGDFEGQKQAYLKSVKNEADEIVRKAREKAGDILKEAHHKGLVSAEDEAKRKRDEGFNKGYEEGLEKGQQEGLVKEAERVEKEWAPLMEQFKGLCEQYQASAESLLGEAEKSLVATALELAENVIEVESRENQEVLEMRLKKAMRMLHLGLELKVQVPVGAREKCESVLDAMLKQEGSKTQVVWSEDENMAPASVVMSTDDSFVKFESEMQWLKLLEKLKLREKNKA